MDNQVQVELIDEEIEYPWLIFKIKDILYTVNSKRIISIGVVPENITFVPNVAKYIVGLIHLRGNVIPLVDLRVLFSNTLENHPKEMAIVFEHENIFLGILVDEVLSVENIITYEETEEIKKINNNNYIKGVAKGEKNSDILLILDEDKLINLA